ncbi:hypothetical protein BVX98_02425 [bacterium F11]|nr:hypothetical protein BVX98_02425 [bacterium F11]
MGPHGSKKKALCAYLREQNFPGVLFEFTTFVPSKDLYAGEECRGIKFKVTNRNTIRPFQIFMVTFLYLPLRSRSQHGQFHGRSAGLGSVPIVCLGHRSHQRTGH